MTYVPADPLLDVTSLRTPRQRRAANGAALPPGAILLESGRVALWAALRAAGLHAGDPLLVPAYICDSVLPAPEALGVPVVYVATDRRLRLDLTDLERELAGGARAVLLVHYFGLPNPDLEQVAALCERFGAALIEDCAHALFSQAGGRPLGSRGAAAIFSPWKSLALPDGGALVLNELLPPGDLSSLPRPASLATIGRLAYRAISVVETTLGWSPRLWLLRSWSLRRTVQAWVAHSPLSTRRGSTLAAVLLRAADQTMIVARRRANFARLLLTTRDLTWASPLYDDLPDGSCPLAFPILVEAREQARRKLMAAGVNVRAYWEQLPSDASVEAFADAHAIANRILVLPVHQSLTEKQMAYLEKTLRSIEVA